MEELHRERILFVSYPTMFATRFGLLTYIDLLRLSLKKIAAPSFEQNRIDMQISYPIQLLIFAI